MKVLFSARFVRSFQDAPEKVRRDFGKQLGLLLKDFRHPSLRTKKYDEPKGIWQARVDGGWRFYFLLSGDTYHFIDIVSHPK